MKDPEKARGSLDSPCLLREVRRAPPAICHALLRRDRARAARPLARRRPLPAGLRPSPCSLSQVISSSSSPSSSRSRARKRCAALARPRFTAHRARAAPAPELLAAVAVAVAAVVVAVAVAAAAAAAAFNTQQQVSARLARPPAGGRASASRAHARARAARGAAPCPRASRASLSCVLTDVAICPAGAPSLCACPRVVLCSPTNPNPKPNQP
jgi:hypothetical protein